MQYADPFSSESGLQSMELRQLPSERLYTQRHYRFTVMYR